MWLGMALVYTPAAQGCFRWNHAMDTHLQRTVRDYMYQRYCFVVARSCVQAAEKTLGG